MQGGISMEQSINNLKCSICSKWYEFYFFDEHFIIRYKSGFRMKQRTINYKDIVELSNKLVIYNFVPFHTYKFIINGQKTLEISATTQKQLNYLLPAIKYIKEMRTSAIMRSENL